MKKQQKRTKWFTRSSHQPSQNVPKRKVKEILRDFGFDLFHFNLSTCFTSLLACLLFFFVNKIRRWGHAGIIFGPVRKSVRNGKKTSACLKKVLRNYALSWDFTFRKTKSHFEIQLRANFFGAITDSSCSCSKNIRICFVFTSAKIFRSCLFNKAT